MSTTWKAARAAKISSMTSDERAEYDAARVEAAAKARLADLVYNARTSAGLTQTELAARAGTRQTVISAIENGAQAPGGVMLERIAQALGGKLTIEPAA